ncbi:MAG: DUF115 domain-containing protein [Azospirillum sp.]|nr:DUF115 domain-containing protein [Azospirillum sp.]
MSPDLAEPTASDSSSPDHDLIERSREALVSRFPNLAEELAKPLTANPIFEDGAVVDLDLGSRRLYQENGRSLAAEQVAKYFKNPLRFFVTGLVGANIGSPVSARMLSFLYAQCDKFKIRIEDLEVKPNYEGTYLVVLGIGLGFHLESLITGAVARSVYIVEPSPELLRCSLATIDWATLLDTAEARGVTFHISIASDPDLIVSDIVGMFRGGGVPFIDGTYVFMHYPAWALFEARNRLSEYVETMFVSRGFFEDELIMMTNATANLMRHPCYLMDGLLKPVRSEPAFLIGSGPSIDETIEVVKRWRDRVILFSCGTALRVCLRNGIVPDFHCEIENGEWIYDNLYATSQEYDISDITLVGSLTVNAKVPALFKRSILFFRSSVSSTVILAERPLEMYGVEPTVANVALRSAMSFGCQEIYMFGIDCGAKSKERKHSKDALYFQTEDMKVREKRLKFPYTVPGNFGGWAQSDWLFNSSRLVLTRLCRLYNVKVYNCSDGAYIDETIPKVAEGVVVKTPPIDRAAMQETICGLYRRLEPGEFLNDGQLSALSEHAERYFADVLETIDAAIEQDRDFVAFWSRMAEFMAKPTAEYAGLQTISDGSSRSIPKIGMFFVHRIRDPEVRRAIFEGFLKEYREIHVVMRDGTLALLDQLTVEVEAAAG